MLDYAQQSMVSTLLRLRRMPDGHPPMTSGPGAAHPASPPNAGQPLNQLSQDQLQQRIEWLADEARSIVSVSQQGYTLDRAKLMDVANQIYEAIGLVQGRNAYSRLGYSR